MADSTVFIDPVAVDWLVNDPAGPTGDLVAELSEKATAIAKSAAPVMKPENFSHWGKMYDPRYQYGPPGDTKASVRWSGFRFNALGQMYSGVNVNYGPTLFLERPARQVRPIFKFMSTALDTVEL